MIWLWTCFLLATGGTLHGLHQRQARKKLRSWRLAAALCGLSVVTRSRAWAWHLKLEAKAGPIDVRMEGVGPGNVDTRIAVVVPGPLGTMRLRSEVFGQKRVLEVEIGDKAFDQAFYIEGPTRRVCMLLDAEVRALLLRANAISRVKIAGGELQAEMSDDQVRFVLPLLLDIGRRLIQKVDFVQCLVDNVRVDPKAGVRLSNLLALVRECARGPRTDKALRAALADKSLQVRLRAAIELGPEGRDVLVKIAESPKRDDCSAQAIRALGRELPFERTTAILKHALRARRVQTACACLEALGGSGTAEAVAALAKVLAQEEDELPIAAAQALGMTANAAAEEPLLLALRRQRSDLRVAAAKALGRVGSPAAVLPLKEAAESPSHGDDLHRATRQAIAEIQSRLQGASPGQLSLAGAETGQLSLAQAEAGQLSLATETAGQLSLPSAESGQLSFSDDESG